MQKKIKEIFNILVPDSLTMEVREDTIGSPYIPNKIPGYTFRKEVLSDILAWVKGAAGNDPLYIAGQTGTGKSTVVEQVAAALNQPLYVVSCHEDMEAPELMGRYVVKNGNMEWQDGPLVAGLKDPLGAWVFLDEMDSLRPGAAMALHALVEGRTIIIPETGEVLNPRKYGAKIIGAGNTNGAGDESGLHGGTNRQNVALMGRFMIIMLDYPAQEDEIKIILSHEPAMPPEFATLMVRVANDLRKDAVNNGIAFCTRSLIRWATEYSNFRKKPGVDPRYYALDRAIGFKLLSEARMALHEVMQRHCGDPKLNP